MKLDSLKQRRIQNLMSSMSAKNERQALAETFGEWKIVKQQEKEIALKENWNLLYVAITSPIGIIKFHLVHCSTCFKV
jgi:ATP-dependent exoDNAse (exonuclease V) beta subunit